MTIKELYELATAGGNENLELYVVFERDSDGYARQAEPIEEYNIEFADEDAIIEFRV